jgi:hypothetical protein
MSTRSDATVYGSQVVTIGAAVTCAIDWEEIDDQSFTISSATAELFDEDDASAVSSKAATVTTGINSAQRTQVALQAVDTAALTAGTYYLKWTLTLSDGQTRIVRSAVRVVAS